MLEHWSPLLKAVKCYDPNDGMLEVFRGVVNDPRVSVAKGLFEGTDADDGWADLIVIATVSVINMRDKNVSNNLLCLQAFHWCLDLEGAVKEFVRVLKPSGALCFLWNGGDRLVQRSSQDCRALPTLLTARKTRDVGWVREVFNYGQSVSTGNSNHDFLGWKRLYDLPTYKENFFPPESETVKYVETSTLEAQLERAMTSSSLAALDDDRKREAREKLKEIIEKGNGLVWINEGEGTFEAPYSVPIVCMKRS